MPISFAVSSHGETSRGDRPGRVQARLPGVDLAVQLGGGHPAAATLTGRSGGGAPGVGATSARFGAEDAHAPESRLAVG